MTQYLYINDLQYVNQCNAVNIHQRSIRIGQKNLTMNVKDNEIFKVLYLFTQKEVKHDIYYLENSNLI